MNHSLRIAVLLVALNTSALVLPMKAGNTQDKKSQAEYANRPAPQVSAETRKEMEARLDEARRGFAAKPNDPGLRIWLGRRLAYLGRFSEAIEVYSEGIKKFPWDARFYRHRGHRYVTLRKFDLAIEDFEKAAKLIKGKPDEVEPDGQPNVRNIPTSTLHFNIWYHLGLAYYLTGQNQQALNSYRECLKVSKNPDALVATSHWLYMTLRRMNRESEAAKELEPISEGMEIIENDGYYRLLLMHKGAVSPEDLLAETLKQTGSAGSNSILYGIGNWYLYNGRRDEALKVLRQMIGGDQWTSFGYIAAEADLRRLS
ncbi:MAG: tetratricopeptide repeat protein [Pyrinomonadaceae bacterium]|nr:tetratricopeptide repeat protein [Pyrinomonadaceae bacterium]